EIEAHTHAAPVGAQLLLIHLFARRFRDQEEARLLPLHRDELRRHGRIRVCNDEPQPLDVERLRLANILYRKLWNDSKHSYWRGQGLVNGSSGSFAPRP